MVGHFVRCEDCGQLYDHSVLLGCPNCPGLELGEDVDASEAAPSLLLTQTQPAPSLQDTDLDSMADLIQATNRTTYAVRALVSYIAILTITAFLAAFVYNFGIGFATSSGNFDILPWTTGLTYAIAIIGSIWALAQFLKEWRLSAVR